MCLLHNSFIVILIIFLPLELVDSVPPNIPDYVKEQNAPQQPKMDKPAVEPVLVPIVVSNNTTEKNSTVQSTLQMDVPKIDQSFEEKNTDLGPGAVNRAVIVFVLISLAFFLFVGVKTCR